MQPNMLPALTLAYMGDAVYEQLVRAYLIKKSASQAGTLHKKAIHIVSAAAQAKALDLIFPHLTDIESDIVRRGRNAKVNTIPKNADPKQYSLATGFEALFGYLYLNENFERINFLFDKIISSIENV